jgi:hypothetical protein
MKRRKPCGRRHQYRGMAHEAGCAEESWPHWHVVCRRCRFAWMQLALFGIVA